MGAGTGCLRLSRCGANVEAKWNDEEDPLEPTAYYADLWPRKTFSGLLWVFPTSPNDHIFSKTALNERSWQDCNACRYAKTRPVFAASLKIWRANKVSETLGEASITGRNLAPELFAFDHQTQTVDQPGIRVTTCRRSEIRAILTF